MRAILMRATVYLLACAVAAPEPIWAQTQAQDTSGQNTTGDAPAPAQPVFKTEEIDQMVAPIALYPDQLLVQVLMASTYPLEVVQAERWLDDPKNAQLKGDQLAAALDPLTWDPSVKSLVPFPPVLKMMNDKLDWTQRLGDAFLAQQSEVMESVQRLRRQAQAAGNLQSTEQQTVTVEPAVATTAAPPQGSGTPPAQPSVVTEKETIVIQPTNPEVVYVPNYNPTTVYGGWPYPAYPPVYYPPPAAYYPVGSALVSGMAFATGAAIVGSMWGWGNCDWHGGNVNINANRYNNINAANIRSGRATQVAAGNNAWRHNPAHRGGVAYRDSATRQAYQRQGGGAGAGASRDFRGYDGAQRGGGNRAGVGAAGQRQASGARAGSVGPGGASGAAAGQRQAGAAAGAAGQRQAGAGAGVGAGQRQAGAGAQARTGQAGARASAGTSMPRQPSAQQRQPSAFQGIGNGSQVRTQANRGSASRQSMGASASRGSFSGGGARAGGGGGARGGGRR